MCKEKEKTPDKVHKKMKNEDFNLGIERAASFLDKIADDCTYCNDVDLSNEAKIYSNAAKLIREEFLKPEKTNSLDINGKKHLVFKQSLNYKELVKLAGEKGQPTIVYFIKGSQKAGSIHPGEEIQLESGIRFTVVHTNNA
jgi:Multiubiquitin